MPKPRRCYTYTTDERLTADVRDGLITEEAAAALRDFRAHLRTKAEHTESRDTLEGFQA